MADMSPISRWGSASLSVKTLALCFLGCLIGTLVGVLPGVGPVATIAMLLPITFGIDPVGALIMLAGIYYGAQYGGSTAADPRQHSGRGDVGRHRARRPPDGANRAAPASPSASRRSARSSPARWRRSSSRPLALPLTNFALRSGRADYFALMVFGLMVAVVLARGSVPKAMAMTWSACCCRPSASIWRPGRSG